MVAILSHAAENRVSNLDGFVFQSHEDRPPESESGSSTPISELVILPPSPLTYNSAGHIPLSAIWPSQGTRLPRRDDWDSVSL